ncbi:MAG: hypothetical protein GXP33_02570 [Spirochaetes bacterium]|nr:hypothetical protein [Spirochaetota bacterium]
MTDNNPTKKLTMSNTKKEMIDAYKELLVRLKEKEEAKLNPEKIIEDKKVKKIIKTAESLSADTIIKDTDNLKLEIGKLLARLSDMLDKKVSEYQDIKEAVEIKNNELKEIYDIEKTAETLAALIEAQNEKRRAFEAEMEDKKSQLEAEIREIRAEWEKEKKNHEKTIRERQLEEDKKRAREKEEYTYRITKEQQLLKDKYEYEKEKTEREIKDKKEQFEKEIAEREKAIKDKELELKELQDKASSFPKELERTVNDAVKEATARIQLEAKNKEELLKKEFDGERRVLTTRISSLEDIVKEQEKQIVRLSQQLEKSYQQVQDIAVKAVDSSSALKTMNSIQQLVSERTSKKQQDKE